MKQYEAVIQAMEDNGGYATFGYLNQYALKVPGSNWGTKTPFASIRRIVQENAEFFRIQPGLWALEAHREAISRKFALGATASTKAKEEFTHSYYQGLLLEIGNHKGLETWIPHQDKNRLYLETPLGEIASLTQFPDFTYDAVLQRVQTIDVMWFNRRGYPEACFEVEHSTDMHNSLLKYVELQDFRSKFHIVADIARQREFEAKLGYTGFVDIRKMVGFLDYENLSELHAQVGKMSTLSQTAGL